MVEVEFTASRAASILEVKSETLDYRFPPVFTPYVTSFVALLKYIMCVGEESIRTCALYNALFSRDSGLKSLPRIIVFFTDEGIVELLPIQMESSP